MKTVNFNKNNSIFSQNLGESDPGGFHGNGGSIKIFTIIFLVLSDNDHSAKVSSNSEMDSGQLFCPLREFVLIVMLALHS